MHYRQLIGYLAATIVELVLAFGTSGAPLNVCRDTPHGELKPGRVGGDDIAPALQWAIDNQHKGHGFEPYVPAGVWVYGEPLKIPNRTGGSLVGVGRGENNTANGGRQTTLIYTGPADEPSLLYQGNNWRIEDICFAGRMIWEVRANKPRPQVGILSTTIKDRNDPNWQPTGTTQLHLDNVAFYGWEAAFQNGSDLGTHNSDMHTLTDVRFRDCHTGFWNLHQMGMGITFTRLDVSNDVEHVLRFDAGGTVRIVDALVSGGGKDQRLIVTGQKVGQGSGGFYIDGFKLDGGVGGDRGFQLIEMLEPAAVDFHCERVHFSRFGYAGQGGMTATLKGDATLTLRDSYRPGKILCEAAGYPGHWPPDRQRVIRPHLLIENCKLAGGKIDVEGPHSLVVRDCLDWDRIPESFSPSPQRVNEVRR